MARKARGESIDPLIIQIVHCTQRCVRQAFLCGVDPNSGQSYEHRREWIRQRLALLASAFGIDCLTYSVMSNHMHLVLRSRPDIVASWSDEEVLRRWLRLFPSRRDRDDSPEPPTAEEIAQFTGQADVIAEYRRRLSDISWWMRCVSENIACRANREDEVTGHFWEGRFGSQVILDEAGLLACAAYVDLNPIRAAMAETPETSDYTGAKDRIDDLRAAAAKTAAQPTQPLAERERTRRGPSISGWMSPLEIDEAHDPAGPDGCELGFRASNKGFLSLSLEAYLSLLDWTGRELRADKRGSIPAQLQPILQRIGLDGPAWCDLVSRYDRYFKRAAGTATSLAAEASRRCQNWLQAPGNPLCGN